MRSHARRDKHTARNQTVDAPSVHQQNARWKTPVHAHDANNHTMDTTGTCHPQKLRWHALTWKPTANGPSQRTVRLLQATMKYCCLERMWRNFPVHMSFGVSDNVRFSCANSHQKKEIEDIGTTCLHAGTEQRVKGITAPPRMIRL